MAFHGCFGAIDMAADECINRRKKKSFLYNQAPLSTAAFCHYYFIFLEQITEGQQAKQQPQIMLLAALRKRERMESREKMVLEGGETD